MPFPLSLRLLVPVALSLILASAAVAQTILPDDRFVYSAGVDYYGADRANLFDTTVEACERACAADEGCVAFTFNTTSEACFPKSAIAETRRFEGALSAVRIRVETPRQDAAAERLSALPDISAEEIRAARELVGTLGRFYRPGSLSAAEAENALSRAQRAGDAAALRRWSGFLVTLEDSASAWRAYAEASLAYADPANTRDKHRARRQALPAALNAYVRSDQTADQAESLRVLAMAFEANNRGRDMIAPLRLARTLSDRADLETALEDAISQYGFRVVDHRVESDSAAPRICIEFSDALALGVDYAPFIRSATPGLVAEAEDRALCIDGVQHGQSYDLTLRSGLPAANGEQTVLDVALSVYVRDRSPTLAFSGRSYVLPALPGAALPITSINAPRAELVLSQVSDRNLIRAIQEDFFARPMHRYQRRMFAEEVATEIWRGTADLATEPNVAVTTRLPLDEALAGQAPGIYVLQARLPGVEARDDPGLAQWFVLSDLGLTTMLGDDGLTVSVRGLSDASARQGVALTLVSRTNAVLGEAVTDAAGFATFPIGLTRGTGGDAPGLVMAALGNDPTRDLAFLPLTDPAFDLSDRGVAGRAAPGPIDVFLATDRGAYRPGEVVNATVLARDAQLNALEALPLTAVLTRPDGVVYRRTALTGGQAGGHALSLPLGVNVPRGTWRLELFAGEDRLLESRRLLVEDFLPDRIEVALDLAAEPLRYGDRPDLIATATYLFGAPGADLRTEGNLRLRGLDRLENWPGFRFGSSAEPMTPLLKPLRRTVTDAQGQAAIALDWPALEGPARPMVADITLRVLEGSGRPVERTLSRPVLPSGGVIGIKPGFDGPLSEGSDAPFDILLLDSSGTPVAGDVTWTLNRVETQYQWYRTRGQWRWEPFTRRERIETGQAAIAASTPLSLAVPVAWGRYELVVEPASQTGQAGPSASSVQFSAGWFGGADATASPDRLSVALDRARYAVGDTATLRVDAPAAGSLMVAVLTNRVVDRQVIDLPAAGMQPVTLPVTADWGAGAYVTAQLVTALQPGGQNRPPTRALGLAYAAVDPGEKALALSIEAPEATDGQPGTVPVTLRVPGAGQNRFVTLAAIDQGIHNLTAHPQPNPIEHYFGQRRLGVELRDLYGRLIDGHSGATGRVRSGGAAASGMTRDGPPPTEALMAWFSGVLEVGPEGTVTVDVPKPAFNGTIRLDAVAWSAEGVGQASVDMVARDPVVLSASMPRFLAPGDQSQMRLSFVHASGPAGPIDLTLDGDGLITGEIPTTLTLEEGGTAHLPVALSAGSVGAYTITVTLGLPDGQRVQKTLTLGVQLNDPETATTRRLSLAPGEGITLDSTLFAEFRPGIGGATYAAGPLARIDLVGLIGELARYPYGCTEQITSAAMPLLSLRDSGLPGSDAVEPRLQAAIDRVLTRQTSAGAFGLWRAESHSLWLDAYVTDFLMRAHEAGFAVPESARRSALANLRNRVNYAPDFDEGGEGLAYALYVLTRAGAASVADLRYYADQKADALGTATAQAHLGAALAAYGDPMRADALFRKAAERVKTGKAERGWRVDYGSGVSDAAALLRLAAEAGSAAIDPAPLIPTLASVERRRSTQEAAQLLMAARALQTAPAQIRVNDADPSGPARGRLDNDGAVAPITLQNVGDRATDVTITTYGIARVPPAASGYGYAIERALYREDGTRHEGPIRSGERLIMVLTVRPFEDKPAQLMIDDPLPAGLEIENPNLLRSGDVAGLSWLQPVTPEMAEFRADRFLAAIDQRDDAPLQLAYRVRAVSPGAYHHPAALVHDMYRPEYRAVTETRRLIVTE